MAEEKHTLEEQVNRLRQRNHDLEKRQARMEYFLNSSSSGYWDWNIQTGEIYFSEKWLENHGYERSDTSRGVEFWKSIVHPEDMKRVMLKVEEHFEGKTPFHQLENRILMKSGLYRTNLNSGLVVEWDGSGAPLRMLCTDTDLSKLEEKEAELREAKRSLELLVDRRTEELRANRDRLDYLLSSSPAIICSRSAVENFPFLFLSDNVRKKFGFEKEDFIHDPSFWISRIHPDDQTRVSHLMNSIIEKKELTIEYRFQRRDRVYVWVQEQLHLEYDEQGLPTEILCAWSDINERKNAEQALQDSEKRVSALIDALPDIILRVNSQGYFLDFHIGQGAIKILPENQILGNCIQNTPIFETVNEMCLDAIAEVIQTGRTETFNYDVPFMGGKIMYEARVTKCGSNEALLILREQQSEYNDQAKLVSKAV